MATDNKVDEVCDNTRPDEIVIMSGLRAVRLKYYQGETILQTARRGDFHINTNCVQGNCGTCELLLLEGKVNMKKNNVLKPEDVNAGRILACQSIPVSSLCKVKV